MKFKAAIMLEALNAGHTFTSTDKITMMAVHDDTGQMYVMMKDEGSGDATTLSLNEFLALCHSIPDEEFVHIERKLADPLYVRTDSTGPDTIDLSKTEVVS